MSERGPGAVIGLAGVTRSPRRHVRVATAADHVRALAFLGGCQLKPGWAVQPEVRLVTNTTKHYRVSPRYLFMRGSDWASFEHTPAPVVD